MDRRNFIKSSALFGGALAAMGPFQALSARRAMGNTLPQSEGYGALVNKDNRTDRVSGFTPNRIQAQDNGAAYFNRLEGMWAGPGESKIYFDTTSGGAAGLGQVWEYDAGRETLTLIYESTSSATL